MSYRVEMGRDDRFGTLAVFFVATVFGLMSAAAAQNLLDDPSFEQPKDRDRWGLVFAKWGGNIYEPEAHFEASRLAHSGKYSCLMVGDLRSKIRVYSPDIKLSAGRYRVRVFLRGMDIGKGQWNINLDFSCGFDGKFFPLKKEGSFGWTPLTYVFEMNEQQSRGAFKLFVGDWGGGRLWVDDASLEKVDVSIPITPEPVFGKEEAPIAPPAPLGAKTVHCPVCAYLINADATECWACGAQIAATGRANLAPVKMIADFEGGSAAPFSGGMYVTQGVIGGKGSLRIDKGWVTMQRPQDWSGYDYLRFDAYNASDKPVAMNLEVRDRQTRDYWTRVNQGSVIPPGKSTISFRTDLYVGEKSRPGRALLRDQINFMAIGVESGPVIIDNVRLERLDTSAAKFEGLLALDFGTLDSPVMEGFAPATACVQYSPLRGYGWVKTEFWRSFNVLQPDALTQDFVTPQNGTFRADLPDGRYHVIVNLDSPGGYWGEPQTYRSRQVTANGRLIVDEKLDFDSFLTKYFRNAHREDLPGINTFDQYVERMFDVKHFDVDVTGGKLELGFKGAAWANCLSYLVLYPAAKAGQGWKFMDWVTQRRRAQFDDYFKQVEPKRGAPPASEYVLFTRPIGVAVNAYDAPAEGEAIGQDGLKLTIARGEESAINFALQPKGDAGEIDLSISKLQNERGDALDAAALVPGWLDYRISRLAMDGSVYTVAPRYWHPTPAPAAPGVMRRFWIRVRMPAGAAPGVYKGQITVKPAKAAVKIIPVTIRALDFALDPIADVAVGPWGSGISCGWDGSDPKTQAWNWSMFEKALDVLREGGCTSFSGRPTLRASARNGKISLDAAEADREMALIRAKGFTQLLSSYGAGSALGYSLYGAGGGPDEGAAKQAGFADMNSFLRALYTAIDQHAKEHNWLPIAWNLCDEPLGDAIPGAVANAKAHRAIAGDLKYSTFMGATSMEGADPKNPHYELVRALPMPSLNLHDEASLKMLREAGNRFSFYNGGNRWTYGRYMKMLVVKHQLALRLSWHFNVAAGDPYYALDCREDDYCWFNIDERQTMIPSISYLSQILPGLNDYRHLSMLQRLLAEKPNHPAAAEARKVWDEMMNLRAGADRGAEQMVETAAARFEAERAAVVEAIEKLLK